MIGIMAFDRELVARSEELSNPDIEDVRWPCGCLMSARYSEVGSCVGHRGDVAVVCPAERFGSPDGTQVQAALSKGFTGSLGRDWMAFVLGEHRVPADGARVQRHAAGREPLAVAISRGDLSRSVGRGGSRAPQLRGSGPYETVLSCFCDSRGLRSWKAIEAPDRDGHDAVLWKCCTT
jgi:hypothetical protein